MPYPTTIFTFGVLLLSYKRIHWVYLTIPLLWTLIGTSAAFSLGITKDYGLDIAGIPGSVLLMGRRTKKNVSAPASKAFRGEES